MSSHIDRVMEYLIDFILLLLVETFETLLVVVVVQLTLSTVSLSYSRLNTQNFLVCFFAVLVLPLSCLLLLSCNFPRLFFQVQISHECVATSWCHNFSRYYRSQTFRDLERNCVQLQVDQVRNDQKSSVMPGKERQVSETFADTGEANWKILMRQLQWCFDMRQMTCESEMRKPSNL